jgi:hypothetical protein
MGMNSSKYDKVDLGQLVPLTVDQMISGKAPATSALKLKITAQTRTDTDALLLQHKEAASGSSQNKSVTASSSLPTMDITNASGEPVCHFATLAIDAIMEGVVEDTDCNRLAVTAPQLRKKCAKANARPPPEAAEIEGGGGWRG